MSQTIYYVFSSRLYVCFLQAQIRRTFETISLSDFIGKKRTLEFDIIRVFSELGNASFLRDTNGFKCTDGCTDNHQCVGGICEVVPYSEGIFDANWND